MKVVVTVVGKDRVGIIAGISGVLAENGVNILNISQNILDGFFNMIMIVDIRDCKATLTELQQNLDVRGMDLGVVVKMQREDIFDSMHRI